jgi:hypothetical protein
VSGIAPRARVIAYKALGNLGGFTSDLAAAIDQAVADGVDVINYSIGGGPALPGADDIAFLFAADAGVFVATSAGNSGPGAETSAARAPCRGSRPSAPAPRTASSRARSRSETVRPTPGPPSPTSSASPLVDAADAGDDLCVPGTLDKVVAASHRAVPRGAIARVDKSRAVMEAGGAGMILYNVNDAGTDSPTPTSCRRCTSNNTPGLAIKAYIASATDPTAARSTRGRRPRSPRRRR